MRVIDVFVDDLDMASTSLFTLACDDTKLLIFFELPRYIFQLMSGTEGNSKDMFKKSKSGSSFKSGGLSAGVADKKIILEDLGYEFDSVTKKSGWNWSSPVARSEHNQPTEGDAVVDAWRDAGERTQEAMNIPAATWERMSVKEQTALLQESLAGE